VGADLVDDGVRADDLAHDLAAAPVVPAPSTSMRAPFSPQARAGRGTASACADGSPPVLRYTSTSSSSLSLTNANLVLVEPMSMPRYTRRVWPAGRKPRATSLPSGSV